MAIHTTRADTRSPGRLHALTRPVPSIVLLSVLFVLFECALLSFRLTRAPDLFADEALYTSIGNNIAAGRGLIEDTGITFVWHPPLFPLLAGGYFKLLGFVDSEPIRQIYALRYMNVGAAALTAVLLLLIGWRIRGRLCGAIVALIFCLDPYVQRINRRAMLETVAALLLVAGIWFFFCGLNTRRAGYRYALAAGVTLGLAALTKEFMAFGLLVLFIFVILYRRNQIRNVLIAGLAAVATYAVYPLWIYSSGNWPAYADMKTRQVFRLFSKLVSQAPAAVQAQSSVSKPRISLWENVMATMPPYAFSYTMIVGGSILALVIIGLSLLRQRQQQQEGIYLIAIWVLVADLLVGTSMVFGRGSDQFFYLVILPVIILVGVSMAPLVGQVISSWSSKWDTSHPGSTTSGVRLSSVLPLWIALVGVWWNLSMYINLFAISQDNGYAALQSYVTQHIPPGTTLEFGNEIGNYIFPEYRVRFDRTPELLHEQGARYVVLSSKERWGGYNNVSRDFYDWVAANSTVRFEHEGPTFWNVQLFELNTPEAQP